MVIVATVHVAAVIVATVRRAIVWGQSAKYQPMRVGKDHLLADEDVIQIVKKCA
jgi:ribosome-interacting GTPase 1